VSLAERLTQHPAQPERGRTDPSDDSRIAGLRAQIARLADDGGERPGERPGVVLPVGAPEIDAALPGGGLPRACLHEVMAGDGSTAAAGFAAVLLARLAGRDGTVVWCRRGGRGPGSEPHRWRLYGGGLMAFGLDLRRLLVVHADGERGILWAMEEALRSGAVAAVLGELAAPPPIARRRLQLAAETGGGAALLLRPFGAAAGTGGTGSRWRVGAAPSPPGLSRLPGPPFPPFHTWEGETGIPEKGGARWRVELVRCRGAVPAAWLVEWCDATHRLAVAAPLSDRPAAPVAPAAGMRRAVND